jgi:hypothetical protein
VQSDKEGILLHACCAPCSTHVIDMLSQYYSVIPFFCNPNIQPEDEYKRRLKHMEKLCGLTKTELFVPDYDPASWLEKVKGLEDEPEGGRRCRVCFEVRLAKTAKTAVDKGFKIFATTLTVSPNKNAGVINEVGSSVAERFGIGFLKNDFKKKDGYKKSCELCRQYDLYRQKYCGCVFSMELKGQ